ncbi:MAG TPA: arsenate reductase ArsC [Actinomycetota bacterium]|nr:arsenate reductase ArsC [Actinomycetota bacterium]
MSGSGSGAAAARDGTATPPRLVAVPGGGNGPGRRPARVVVFLGIDDDVRSRVAAALLAHRSKGRVRAVSASQVTVDPDPAVAASLAELGVDLGLVASQPPSAALLDGAELVVVMGYDRDVLAAGRRSEDWYIDDPRGKNFDAVRCIRDALDRRVQRLLIRMGVALPTRSR